MAIKARKAKPLPPLPESPMQWTRADPAALAQFDPSTKTCTMNCGPHGLDPRSREERLFLCDDCDCHEPKGTHAMTDHKPPPLTLELTGYLVDALADWLRADAKAMHPATPGTDKRQAREERALLADAFVRGALHYLPEVAAEGDLAAALNERAEAYAAYDAANPR